MKILIINAGSSSLKFTLYDMPDEKMLAKGIVERLGLHHPHMKYKRFDGKVFEDNVDDVRDYKEALKKVCDKLLDSKIGVISKLSEIEAIGHRVVHGGEHITKPIPVDEKVKKVIKECFSLAPLHNPPNMAGIEACENIFPGVPNVAVFDTAFHQTMEPEAYRYAIPEELYKKYGIRKYGFHGTSHHFVSLATSEFLKVPIEKLKIITCHLGNGCSMAAIKAGKVIDTTMGMTPLDGLMMGTRCGDIDPGVVLHLLEVGFSSQEVNKLLNKKSGLLGVAEIDSSDMRDVIEAFLQGNDKARLALQLFSRRIAKYIGAYHVFLDGADLIVFTGGIGEYASLIRKMIIDRVKVLGIELNEELNEKMQGVPGFITARESRIKVLVIPTNEELMIARSTFKILNK